MRDLTGQVFGRLTVVEYARNDKHNNRYWLCRCECGEEREVQAGNLANGHTQSCGCLNMERTGETNTVHGGSRRGEKTPEYEAWGSMRKRCNDPSATEYPNYGGRGIRICERWDDFGSFLSDMGERPSDEHSIDRIDNDGNYEPQNCRWATRTEQMRNRRNTITVEYDGRVQSLAGWADEFDMDYSTLYKRIREWGWATEEALVTPVRSYQR